MSRRPRSDSGTSPATMRWASPSTTAVLPTPGSPMSTGLFLVRRLSTCTTRRISAVAADDRVELAVAGDGGQVDAVLLQRLVGVLGVGAGDPRAAADRRRTRPAARRGSRRQSVSSVPAGDSTVAMPTTRCSLETKSSPSWAARSWARCSTSWELRDSVGLPTLAPDWRTGDGRARPSAAGRRPAGRRRRPPSSGTGGAARLGEQGVEQVGRLDGRIAGRRGGLNGGRQRLLAARGVGRKVHGSLLAEGNGHSISTSAKLSPFHSTQGSERRFRRVVAAHAVHATAGRCGRRAEVQALASQYGLWLTRGRNTVCHGVPAPPVMSPPR